MRRAIKKGTDQRSVKGQRTARKRVTERTKVMIERNQIRETDRQKPHAKKITTNSEKEPD